MSQLAILKEDLQEACRTSFSIAYYRLPKNNRMKGVIVEKSKRRCIRSYTNAVNLLAKEELCCNMATD